MKFGVSLRSSFDSFTSAVCRCTVLLNVNQSHSFNAFKSHPVDIIS